jgi:hypothetical protein
MPTTYFAIATAGLTLTTVLLNKAYLDNYNAYKNATNEEDALRLHNEVRDNYDQVEKYETYRNIFIGAAIVIWGFNIYDAYKLGKKIEENNRSLLSILKSSKIYVSTVNSYYSLGFVLSL